MQNPPITPQMIQERIIDATAAMDAEDWATALIKLETARTLMGGLPSRFSSSKTELEYSPDQLDATIARVRRLANRQKGGHDIVHRPIVKARRTRCE